MNAAWMVAAHPVAFAEVRIQQPEQRPQPHPRRRLTLPTLHRLEPGSDVEQAQARLAEGCAALARVLPHPVLAHRSCHSVSRCQRALLKRLVSRQLMMWIDNVATSSVSTGSIVTKS